MKKTINIDFNYSNNFCYNCADQNQLGKLFDHYGSNKGYGHYNNQQQPSKDAMCYNDIYDLLFSMHKNQVTKVIECGVGSKNPKITGSIPHLTENIEGGSLRTWKEYFPYADIIGIDIDPEIMFTEDRISTYICDQTSADSIHKFINIANLTPGTIDIIIDDGLHEINANITLFENTKDLLTDNGVYVIEDVWAKSNKLPDYIKYFNKLSNYYSRFIKINDDYLIVITKIYTLYQ